MPNPFINLQNLPVLKVLLVVVSTPVIGFFYFFCVCPRFTYVWHSTNVFVYIRYIISFSFPASVTFTECLLHEYKEYREDLKNIRMHKCFTIRFQNM